MPNRVLAARTFIDEPIPQATLEFRRLCVPRSEEIVAVLRRELVGFERFSGAGHSVVFD